ncbi:hypothetical protein NSK_000659 [Nannochloropsis salina CCMP1776]|uniref:Transmembrane protein 184C n=1 Tax=Nannochloropsis salina CCMP1776 TaxID=1027361 RepID=A0A4D9DA43_9STRA|nr:hypothetical protein NSK_000659 [Nannochloropsis salina CCMP1776]|eukprot:TFJ88310.1 hypothetical protein NSK_000659 [Nannochloropsis salina CCMP1776]
MMKRDIVETDYDASDEDSDCDSQGEEGIVSGSRPCFCCQVADSQIKRVSGRPPRLLNFQQSLSRLAMISTYVCFIFLAVQQVNFVLTNSTDKHEMAWTIGGAFVIATVPISLFQIFQHLSNFVEPKQQTHVIRMISMVPLYAIQSWFSLRYQSLSLYTQCVREAYESYVIYAFVQYLINYMGSEEQLIRKLETKPAVLGRHMAPFCCLPPWSMGAEFLKRCKVGVLQYLGVRLATLVFTFALESLDMYAEGEYTVRRGFFWMTVANCISQTWALYILILFYHATHKELISINPCGKFFSVKSVVFASWWQSLLIGLMVHQGTIGELDSHSAEMVAKAIQDLLICTEMFMAAIAFTFAFPVSDFVSPIEPPYYKDPGSDAQDSFWEGEGALHRSLGGVEGGGPVNLMGDESPTDTVSLLKSGGAGTGEMRRGMTGAGKGTVPSFSAGQHAYQQNEGGALGRGSSVGGDGGHVSTIWSALWTSCVPMDVREDFKLATRQIMEDCACLKRGGGGAPGGVGLLWGPCRCRTRCGQAKAHRSSSSINVGGREGGNGKRMTGRHSSAAPASPSSVVLSLGGIGSAAGGASLSLGRAASGGASNLSHAKGGSACSSMPVGDSGSSTVSSSLSQLFSSSRQMLV